MSVWDVNVGKNCMNIYIYEGKDEDIDAGIYMYISYLYIYIYLHIDVDADAISKIYAQVTVDGCVKTLPACRIALTQPCHKLGTL